MLRKLFKYDFLAIGKNMWIFTIIAICLAVVACFTFNGIYEIGNFIGNAPSDRDLALGVSLMMAAVMLFAVFGQVELWTAVFADVGVCLLAVLNSLRASKI